MRWCWNWFHSGWFMLEYFFEARIGFLQPLVKSNLHRQPFKSENIYRCICFRLINHISSNSDWSAPVYLRAADFPQLVGWAEKSDRLINKYTRCWYLSMRVTWKIFSFSKCLLSVSLVRAALTAVAPYLLTEPMLNVGSSRGLKNVAIIKTLFSRIDFYKTVSAI